MSQIIPYLKEPRGKAKERRRNNVYSSCGQHTEKVLKEGGGIKVDLELLEQKQTSALVYNGRKSRVRKESKTNCVFKISWTGKEYSDADGLQLIWEVLQITVS